MTGAGSPLYVIMPCSTVCERSTSSVIGVPPRISLAQHEPSRQDGRGAIDILLVEPILPRTTHGRDPALARQRSRALRGPPLGPEATGEPDPPPVDARPFDGRASSRQSALPAPCPGRVA